jgi:hypothetical protein
MGCTFTTHVGYDPAVGRFLQADTIVPGSASGAGGGAATLGYDGQTSVVPLTVDYHEPGFLLGLNQENAFTTQNGFWFQLSDQARQQAKIPFGPQNPQALNRYAYTLNNPLRYTDPTGHETVGDTDFGYEQDDVTNELTIWLNGQSMVFDLDLVDIPTYDRLRDFKDAVNTYTGGRNLALASMGVGFIAMDVYAMTIAIILATSGAPDVATAGSKKLGEAAIIVGEGIVIGGALVLTIWGFALVEQSRNDGLTAWNWLTSSTAVGRIR